jgi:hypothetical protein
MLIRKMLTFMRCHCLPTALEWSSLGHPLGQDRTGSQQRGISRNAWLSPPSGDLHPSTAAVALFSPKRNIVSRDLETSICRTFINQQCHG